MLSPLNGGECFALDNIETEETAMAGPIAPLKRKSYSRTSEKTRHGNLFDRFAEVQRCPKIDEFTLDSINSKDENGNRVLIHTLECYATFVLNQRQKMKNDQVEMYKCEGYDKMFATPKTILAEKFKGEEWLQKGHPKNTWWADLYSDFKIRNRVQCLENGAPLEESTEGITRKQFIVICDGVMRGVHNKTGAVEPQDIEMLAAMSVTRAAVGRSGESGLITVDKSMSWSGQWDIDWGEMKKGASTKLGMYHDAQEFLICPYFGTVSLVIACPRLHDTNTVEGEPKWLFPKLASYVNGGAAGKITKVIHDVCKALGSIEGLHEKLVGHGLRAGAADDILLSVHSLDNVGILLGAIFRGGWEFVSECVMLRYLFKKKYIALAGKILAGYDVPEQDVAQPSLQSIFDSPDGEEYGAKVGNLALLVFAGAEWNSKLRPLRDCLLATAFLHHKAVVERYGKTHLVAANFICFCSQVGIPERKIEQWGERIRRDMDERNKQNRLVALRYKGDSSHRASLLEEQNRLLREEMDLMRANQRAQAEEFKQLMVAQQAREEERDRQMAVQQAQNQAMVQQIHAMMAQLVKPQRQRIQLEEVQPLELQNRPAPGPETAVPLTPPAVARMQATPTTGDTQTPSTTNNTEPAAMEIDNAVPPHAPTAVPSPVEATTTKRKSPPIDPLVALMKQAKTDGKIKVQRMDQKKLMGTRATALLEMVRRQPIHLASKDPFGNSKIDRGANCRARTLFKVAMEFALNSENEGLIAAAKYIGCKTPIDKSDDAAMRKALEVLPAMSSAIINYMNHQLIVEYENSAAFASKVQKHPEHKRETAKISLIKSMKNRLKGGTIGKVSGVLEERSKWKKP